MVAVAAGEHYDSNRHTINTRYVKELCGSSRGSNLLPGCPPFLDRRLSVTLFQCGQSHRGHKLLLAVIIKLDDDVLVVTRDNRTETKLRVFDLRALSERWFTGHERRVPSIQL